MLRRAWRLAVMILTFGVVKLEMVNPTATRRQLVDERVREVAKAREGLGVLAGAVAGQAQEVERLEGVVRTVTLRKVHYMRQVKDLTEGTSEATFAKQSALEQHRELDGLKGPLDQARQGLARRS